MSKYDFLFDSDSPLFKKSSFVRISESVPEYPSDYKADTEAYMSSSNSDKVEEDLVGSNSDEIEEDLMGGVEDGISSMSPEDRSSFERARTQLEKGISHLEEDVDTLEALNKIVEELNKKNEAYDASVDPGSQVEDLQEPDWVNRISHYMDANNIKAAGLKPIGSIQDPDKSNKDTVRSLTDQFKDWLEIEKKIDTTNVPMLYSDGWNDYWSDLYAEFEEDTKKVDSLFNDDPHKIKRKF